MALVLAWAAWLLVDASDRQDLVRRLGWGALAIGVMGVAWGGLPDTVADAWVQPIREGGTDVAIRLARGEGVEGGPVMTRVVLPALAGSERSIDAAIRADMVLAAGWAVALVAVGWRVTGSAFGAAVVLAGTVASLPMQLGVLSGGPAPILWWNALIVGTALPAVWRGSVRSAVPALIVVAAGAGVAALTRPELGGAALVCVTLAGLHRWGAGDAVATWWRGRRGVFLVAVVVLLGGATLAHTSIREAISAAGRWGWGLQALVPTDPSAVTLGPVGLSMLPLGLLVLAVVGGVQAPVRNLGVGLAAWVVARIHHAAGHGGLLGSGDWAWPLELVRYLSYGLPLVVGLAWWGWASLGARARVVVALLMLVPRIPDAWRPQGRESALWGALSWPEHDLREEVLIVRAAMRTAPSCGFIAPGSPSPDGSRPWYAWRATAGVQTRSEGRFVLLPVSDRTAAAHAVPGAPPCVLLFTGSTCALDGCEAATAGLVPWIRRTVRAPGHAHPKHRLASPPWEAVWWVVEGEPPPAGPTP